MNERIASSFLLVALLWHCDPSGRDARRSGAASSASAARFAPKVPLWGLRDVASASASSAAHASSAPPLAINRAPTGEGDDFYIEVPKLTVDAPPVAGEAAVAPRKCPPELARRDTPREKLERLASSGDPCGKAALASKLMQGRPPRDAFRQALRLAIEAQDAGVTVWECFLFDFADDASRLVTCAERTGNLLLSSLLHVSGHGVRRDLDRATEILEKDESRACGYSQVKAIIEAERARPTRQRYVFCRDGACTTLEWDQCQKERLLRYDWKSSGLRAKLAEAASSRKLEFEGLLDEFDEFVEHDSSQVYWGVDGLLASSRASSQELELRRRFDALLERVLVARELSDATEAEIKSMQKRVHDLDRLFLKRKPTSDPRAAERYVTEYFSAQKAYQKLEQRFVRFATAVLEKDRGRAARAALLRMRGETLELASQP
jgi:hypothetical protein